MTHLADKKPERSDPPSGSLQSGFAKRHAPQQVKSKLYFYYYYYYVVTMILIIIIMIIIVIITITTVTTITIIIIRRPIAVARVRRDLSNIRTIQRSNN